MTDDDRRGSGCRRIDYRRGAMMSGRFRSRPRHGKPWSWSQRPLVDPSWTLFLKERLIAVAFIGVGFAVGVPIGRLIAAVLL
ncbi:hypothetical protein [Tsukamurella sp. NPDC003166]|uniref:hypothetical protein n=1 Tax=Tsukamurella sp. NPDC003166 TaxID=3154444 RepID=UPI0033A6654A